MRRVFLISVFALMTVASFGRKHIENATVVADTIYYADNMLNVTSAEQAGYYRLLMTQGVGSAKKDVFQDFYMNGNLKASHQSLVVVLAIQLAQTPYLLNHKNYQALWLITL